MWATSSGQVAIATSTATTTSRWRPSWPGRPTPTPRCASCAAPTASSTTSTKTSRWWTTNATPPSRPRSPSEDPAHAAEPDFCPGRQWRDRPRQRPALAPARRPGPLQAPHPGLPRHHGAAHLGLAATAFPPPARPPEQRAVPRPGLGGRGRPPRRLPVRGPGPAAARAASVGDWRSRGVCPGAAPGRPGCGDRDCARFGRRRLCATIRPRLDRGGTRHTAVIERPDIQFCHLHTTTRSLICPEMDSTSTARLYKNNAAIKKTEASNQWNYFQSKSTKQSLAELARDLAPEDKKATYQAKVERYDKEKNEIKLVADKLEAEAKEWDEQSDEQMHQHHRWAQSTTALQVAIALAAIALLTKKRWLEYGMFGVAAIGLAIGTAAALHI